MRADGQRQDSGVRASPGPWLSGSEDHDEASCARRRAHRRPGVPGGACVRAPLPGGRPESRGQSRVRAETRRRRRRGDRLRGRLRRRVRERARSARRAGDTPGSPCRTPARNPAGVLPGPASVPGRRRGGPHPAAVVPELDAAGGGRRRRAAAEDRRRRAGRLAPQAEEDPHLRDAHAGPRATRRAVPARAAHARRRVGRRGAFSRARAVPPARGAGRDGGARRFGRREAARAARAAAKDGHARDRVHRVRGGDAQAVPAALVHGRRGEEEGRERRKRELLQNDFRRVQLVRAASRARRGAARVRRRRRAGADRVGRRDARAGCRPRRCRHIVRCADAPEDVRAQGRQDRARGPPRRRVHAVSPRRGGAVPGDDERRRLEKAPRPAHAAGAGGRGHGRAQSGSQGRAGRREAAPRGGREERRGGGG